MDDSALIAMGPCLKCQNVFMFDPDTVPSMPIDPVTGKTPDLGGDAARAVNQPICPTCIDLVNPIRKAKGLQEIPHARESRQHDHFGR